MEKTKLDTLLDMVGEKNTKDWYNLYPQSAKEPATWSIDRTTKKLIRALTEIKGKRNQSVMINQLIIMGIKDMYDEGNDEHK